MCVCVCVCVCADDTVLVQILPLSQEYQANHIRVKCETYIALQLRDQGELLSLDRKLLYLLVSEQYRMQQTYERLLELCSKLSIDTIERSQNWKKLAPATQIDLLQRRCHVAEKLFKTSSNKCSDQESKIFDQERKISKTQSYLAAAVKFATPDGCHNKKINSCKKTARICICRIEPLID